jgi:hypothetical protein
MRRRAVLVRVAIVLWIVWAIVAWNVVLDQMLVLAGRRYIVAAVGAAQGPGPYARIDDWMRPALARGLVAATLTAISIVATGLVSVSAAARTRQPSR